MIRATKVMPSSCFRPWMTRFAFAAALSSFGFSPSALSIIARNALLAMFQPFDWPFSSTLPPATVKVCQNFRRANGPSTTVNSQSRSLASLGIRGLEEAGVGGRAAVETAGTEGQRDAGEGAVGDELADRGHLRLGIVEVVHGDRPVAGGQRAGAGAAALILARSWPRSGGSVMSRRPERSLAGRP